MTPADIQAITFQRAPIGRRGYDESQVDATFDQVEREFVQLLNERTQLSEEVARLRQRVYGEPVGDAPLGVRPQDAHIQAVRILSQAQQTADQYISDAEEYGRQLAKDARRGREEILSEAKSRAVLILEEAHQQAERAAAAAGEAAAGDPGGAARGTAAAGGGPAANATTDARPGADGAVRQDERRSLEHEITYLRTFSEVYRQHLRSYLEALLHNIGEWERSERAAPAPGDLERLASAAGGPDGPNSAGPAGPANAASPGRAPGSFGGHAGMGAGPVPAPRHRGAAAPGHPGGDHPAGPAAAGGRAADSSDPSAPNPASHPPDPPTTEIPAAGSQAGHGHSGRRRR